MDVPPSVAIGERETGDCFVVASSFDVIPESVLCPPEAGLLHSDSLEPSKLPVKEKKGGTGHMRTSASAKDIMTSQLVDVEPWCIDELCERVVSRLRLLLKLLEDHLEGIEVKMLALLDQHASFALTKSQDVQLTSTRTSGVQEAVERLIIRL
ncbi:hypothetical protein NDU88_007008 [Pleurodeles waltl]|uniref:Uncharacterized protein n=1 Tax=Pleurodeles waltl TaxID=8319 RepID=A0AAV7NRX9_PLEWA|nr:hypothetical protein NDU88_007008 [Pleurodeles waltl]